MTAQTKSEQIIIKHANNVLQVLHCSIVYFLLLLMAFMLASCFSSVQHVPRKDSAPTLTVDPSTLTDAIPRHDSVTRAGNKNPYTVLGKTYHLLSTSKGYSERGIASWYGTKFQGRPTANGEKYNLYAMTAAHRTLKIPAYVKVTNLDNGLSVIVRVNDRGPFHDNRIIDLSYAAAVKLGYADKGIANVQVEAIALNSRNNSKHLAKADGVYFLQAGAFKSRELATKLREKLLVALVHAVTIKSNEAIGYYQVHIGPLTQLADVQKVSDQLLALGLGQPHMISR